jgi:hypothetical protein
LRVRVLTLFCDEETRADYGACCPERQESGEMCTAGEPACREHGRSFRGWKGGQHLRKEVQNRWSGS